MLTEQKPLISGSGAKTTAEEALAGRDLRGKVAIVTGGHAGLGLETTRVLSNAGATVVIGSRDPKKAQMTVARMKKQGAAMTIWAAVSPQLNGKGGVYCENCDIAAMVPADSKLYNGVRPWAVDKSAAEALWILSEKLTAISAGAIA